MKYNLFNRKLIVLFLLVIAVIPYVYISQYSNPISDDFTYALKGRNPGIFNTALSEYQNWNGRYISNLFVLLNPISNNSFVCYKLTGVLMTLLSIGSLYYVIRALTITVIKKIDALTISLAVTLLYLYQMPIISEGVYWYTGAVTYQLGIISFLIYLGSFVMFFRGKFVFGNKIAHLILLVILLFVTVGFNEIIMISTFLFSLIFFLITHLNKLRNKGAALLLLLASFAFCCIVYFAPGNSVRESYFPDNHQLFSSLGYSFAQVVRFFFKWISSAPLLLISFLYYFLNKKLSSEIGVFKNSFYLNKYTSLLLLFLVIFIGVFPAYWSTGILGQHRTVNISYFLFIIMWFINLTVFYNLSMVEIKEKGSILKWGMYFLIWSSLVFTKNGYNVLDDLFSGNAAQYDVQMNTRYSIIADAKSRGDLETIYFDPIANKPKSLFVLDITDDPHNWRNRGYAVFFDIPKSKIDLNYSSKSE